MSSRKHQLAWMTALDIVNVKRSVSEKEVAVCLHDTSFNGRAEEEPPKQQLPGQEKPTAREQSASLPRNGLLQTFHSLADTMIQFMWQADLHGVAKFVTDCLGVYYSTDPDGGQASDQP